jgi:ABC-2 type transport system permease protein
MNAFLQHFAFEFRTGIRNRTLLFLTYLFPLAVYLILGSLMTSVNPLFGETLIPAMVLIAILAGTLLSVPETLVTARQAGIFRSYKINGVPALSILLMPALAAFVHLLVIAVIITSTAPFIFGAPLPTDWLSFSLTVVLAIAAFAGLSLLIGVLAASPQAAMLLAQLIFLPSMLLGGLMMPLSVLPPALGTIARLLPTTYAMNAFRALAFALPPDMDPRWSLVILLAGGAAAFALALGLFTWDDQSARQPRRMLLALLALVPYLAGLLLLR